MIIATVGDAEFACIKLGSCVVGRGASSFVIPFIDQCHSQYCYGNFVIV